MQSFIQTLYQSILIPIFTEWLDVCDLCALDTAICHQRDRKYFVTIIQKCVTSLTYEGSNRSEMYGWALLRGVTPLTLNYEDCKLSESELERLLSNTKKLLSLEITDWKNTNQLPTGIKTVRSLRLNRFGGKIMPNFGSINGVEILDVSECQAANLLISQSYRWTDLRVVTLSSMCSLLPVLQLPCIERINNCNLVSVLNDGSNIFSYSTCDLVRVDVFAPSVFHLAGKYFCMTKLVVYNLEDNYIGLVIPHIDDKLEHLEINMYFNYATIQNALLTCPQLTYLKCHRLYSIEFVPYIPQFPLLRAIHFSRSYDSTSTLVESLAQHCPLLEALTISCYNSPQHCFMKLFDACPYLSMLKMGIAPTNDTMVSHLAVDLTSLIIRKSDSLASVSFKERQGLRKLEVCSKYVTGYVNFKRLFACNPLLTKIELLGLKQLTDQKLHQLTSLCPLLTDVRILSCSKLTATGFDALLPCPYLSRLSIESQYPITDSFLLHFISSHPNLLKLGIKRCSGFNGSVLASLLAKYCRFLHHLDFTVSIVMESSDIITLLQGCPRLDTLLLSHCSLVDARIFPALAEKKRMRHVVVPGERISREEFETFEKESKFTCSYQLYHHRL